MAKNNMLGVKEFAERAGVSQQAVYKQLNTRLKPYVELVEGRKLIAEQALFEIYGIEVKQTSNQENNQPHNQNSTENNPLYDILREELTAKNKQIEQLQAQVAQLTSALENTTASLRAAQALHAGTMKQQLLAESPPEEEQCEDPAEPAVAEQPVKKPSLWKRLFG